VVVERVGERGLLSLGGEDKLLRTRVSDVDGMRLVPGPINVDTDIDGDAHLVAELDIDGDAHLADIVFR